MRPLSMLARSVHETRASHALHGDCRAVAPLLARHGDPDLTETERILLGTHLPRCAACWARLQDYRHQDQRLRALPPITLAPRVRCAILDHVAATAAARAGRPGLLRPALSSVAVAAVAVLLAGSLGALPLPATEMATAADSPGTANTIFAQPLTATFLSVNPTRAITAVTESKAAGAPVAATAQAVRAAQPTQAPQAAQARGVALIGTVRVLYLDRGRLVLALRGGGDQGLAITRDTAVHLADGRPGALSDLSVGTAIRVYCSRSGDAAQEIVVLR